MIRLVIDAARCDGHGICVLRCPDLISLDEWGYARVDPTPTASAMTTRRARRAVLACPANALLMVAVPAAEAQSRDATAH